MSDDTTTRVEALVESLITTPNSYKLINESINPNFPEQGSGLFITLGVEIDEDEPMGTGVSNEVYLESGIVVFTVYCTNGNGVDTHGTVRKKIRDALRGYRISATGSQEGTLYFHRLTTQPKYQLNRKNSRFSWAVQRFFLTYIKYYDL